MRGAVQERGSATFRWPLHPTSVRLSRGAVQAMCAFWRTTEVCQSAVLAVSELVGNSVRAGCGESVLLRLSWTTRRLRVEVHDQAPGLPEPTEAEPLAESGRGLWIIAQLAVRWGTLKQPLGKMVWAEIALPGTA